MRKFELKRITAALRQMSPIQRKIVATELAALDAQPASTLIIEGRFAATASCPHCKAERVSRHGHANGLQRYRCTACRKTFNALTGTPLCGLHKRGTRVRQLFLQVIDSHDYVFKKVYYNRAYCCALSVFQLHAA